MRVFGIEIAFDLTPPPTEEEIDTKLERYNELYEKDTAFICCLNQFRSLFRLISFFVICLEALWKGVYGGLLFNSPDP